MGRDLNSKPALPDAPGAAAADADLDLPIRGFKGTPEEIERQWFEKIYTGRGDSQKQLTLRAVLMGGVLGMLMSISNLYTTLKLGWAFGVAITACVIRGQTTACCILDSACFFLFVPQQVTRNRAARIGFGLGMLIVIEAVGVQNANPLFPG